MNDCLTPIGTKCELFFEQDFPQTGGQELFVLRSLKKSRLTINVQVKNTQLHCPVRGLRLSRAYDYGEQFYCNAELQRHGDRDLGLGHTPSVQGRALKLPPEACFSQYPLGARVHSVAQFGRC